MKTRIPTLTALLVLPLLAAGCEGAPTAPEPPADWHENLVPDDPDIRLLAQDSYGGLTDPAELVVRTEEAWDEVWDLWTRGVTPRPDRPAVDFETEMVIVAAMGSRSSGGYAIGIERVEASPDHLAVDLFTVSPGSNCFVTMALTAPAVAIAVPASEGTVDFRRTDYVNNCD